MWLSMVNVKPPQLMDLEVENMKKFIFSIWNISNIFKNVLSLTEEKCSFLSLESTWK
jgi:hypothetical protein